MSTRVDSNLIVAIEIVINMQSNTVVPVYTDSNDIDIKIDLEHNHHQFEYHQINVPNNIPINYTRTHTNRP